MCKTMFYAGLLLLFCAAAPAGAVDAFLMGNVRAAQAAGDHDQAVGLLETAFDAVEAEDHVTREAVLGELGAALVAAGRDLDAAYVYAKLAILRKNRLGKYHPEVAGLFETAARAFERAGEPTLAVSAYDRALAIDALHYGADSKVATALYRRLADLHEALGNEAEHKKFSLLAAGEAPAVEEKAPSGRGVTVEADYGDVDENTFAQVRIYYATDRARTGSDRPNDFFGGERGELSFGTAEVSIPHSHKPGAMETPELISFELTENPEKHIVLRSITTLKGEDALAAMRAHVATSGSDEAFVFVHGYNVPFAWAARRTAQLAYDLNFEGLPILYSWPSRGSPLDYMADTASVRFSGRRLSRVLDQIVASSGAKRIHLIAHSMGNRALTDALELFALRRAQSTTTPAFEQVLFTAPDVDAGLFTEMLSTIRPVAKRMTLYASQNDLALITSRSLHGGVPRAGQGGDDILVSELFDTVDMTALGEDMLGHNYFADHASALTDMLSLFWRDAPPTKRCGMVKRSKHDHSYWLFDPQACRGAVALSAMTLLKKKGSQALQFAKSMADKWRLDGNQEAAAEWREISTVMGAMVPVR